MTRFATIGRWCRRIAWALLSVLLLYGTALLVLPRVAVNRDWQLPDAGVEVVVQSNGVHTDFIVPVATAEFDWSRHLPPSDFEAVDDRFRWISLGWGSRAFYLETPNWSDLRLATALRAVSGVAPTALHVSYRFTLPPLDDRARRVRLTPAQYRQLCDEVLATFACDAAGRVQRIDAPGYTPYDRFYEAHDHYSAIVTCNEWTGARLRSIGVKVGVWTPLADDVLRFLPR